MRNKGYLSLLRWLSLILIFASVALTGAQLVSYSRIRADFPPGLVIAGVPVGGLDQRQAADRLIQVYGYPVELRYGNATIQMKPATAGFELNLEAMLAAADLQRINQPFWNAFWDYLWGRSQLPSEVPVMVAISKERLRTYLKFEISARYDQPAIPAMPAPGSTSFQTGQPGTVLDIERAIPLVEDALRSPVRRIVNLPFNQVSPTRPSQQNLQILLEQIIDVAGFDGIVEVYLLDLQTRQELHFAHQNKKTIQPNIAFTAASTMKIPIMVSVFRRLRDPIAEDVIKLLELMIERSENDPADSLMEKTMGGNLGPLQVTTDLQTLGLENTFLAGYFYPGAPLLKRFSTPANQRKDVNISPDVYNQTTALEMGMLLDDLYQCATTGGGSLVAAFPGEIAQSECRLMISYLALNRIGVLIQAGLPEGTQIAHKHGWITEADGLIHTMSDVGIVYTTGGNYILTIYVYHPRQLFFDDINQIVAELSAGIYNYFNITNR